jgi:hypothetical protein
MTLCQTSQAFRERPSDVTAERLHGTDGNEPRNAPRNGRNGTSRHGGNVPSLLGGNGPLPTSEQQWEVR